MASYAKEAVEIRLDECVALIVAPSVRQIDATCFLSFTLFPPGCLKEGNLSLPLLLSFCQLFIERFFIPFFRK